MLNLKETTSISDREFYNYIKEYYDKHKYMPSIREICNMTGLKSTSTVHARLKKLKKQGLIESDHNFAARAYRFST